MTRITGGSGKIQAIPIYMSPLEVPMPNDADDAFYARADAHIHLSNDQLKDVDNRGKVSASMMYATARFNAWVSACDIESSDAMAKSRDEMLEYFVEQYRLALAENLDDYIEHFDTYMTLKH
jgi:hypothetical protein